MNISLNGTLQRDRTIDIAKGITIILVVIGHLNHFFQYTNPLIIGIYSFHMPLFVCLSGYFFKRGKEDTFIAFLNKKFNNLIVPYFLLAFLTLFIQSIFNERLSSIWLKGIFIGNGLENRLDFNIALWFLPMLFFSNVLFYFISYIAREKIIIKTLLCTACSAIGIYLTKISAFSLWNIDLAFVVQLFMLFGYTLKLKKEYIQKIYSFPVQALLLITVVLGAFYNGRIDMNARCFNNPIIFYFTAIAGTLIILKISMLLEKVKYAKDFFGYLGIKSLYIMALHIPAGSIMYNIFMGLLPTQIQNYLWKPNIAGTLYIVAGSIMISLFVERCLRLHIKEVKL